MFDSVFRGWKVGSATRKLVFQDKGLLLYPAVSGVVGIGEVVALFGSIYLFGALSAYVTILALLVYYPVVAFTSTYFLMAMLIAFRRFTGGERIGMMEALSSVRPYSKVIAEWAVFITLIMLVIRLVQAPLGRLFGFVFALVASISITFATVFALPVMLDNNSGPIKTLKESAAFLARNFGKSFGGILYSDLFSMLLLVPGLLLVFVGVVVGIAADSVILALVFPIAGAVLIFFAALLSYTMQNVLKLIIYEHANGRPLPQGFTPELVSQSVKLKKSKASTMQAPPAFGVRYCPNCGRQVESGSAFCSNCGSPQA